MIGKIDKNRWGYYKFIQFILKIHTIENTFLNSNYTEIQLLITTFIYNNLLITSFVMRTC